MNGQDLINVILSDELEAKKLELVQEFINKKVDLNYTDDSDDTALHYAARFGYMNIARLLINNGAEVNKKDCAGNTPLHEAALSNAQNKNEMWQLLIDNKATKLIKNKKGHSAAELIKSGGKVNLSPPLEDKNVKTNIGVSTHLHKAISNSDTRSIDQYLNNKDYINAQNEKGQTPLHIAISMENIALAKKLIMRYELNLNLQNDNGDTVLHQAIDNKELVDLLLEKKLNNSIPNKKDNTPLHIAAKNGNLGVIESLLRKNASTTLLNAEGKTAANIAKENRHFEIVKKINGKRLIDVILSNNPEIQDIETVGDMLKNKDEIDLDFHYDKSAIKEVTNDKGTALHWAVILGKIEIARLLIDSGVKLNTLNSAGKTPLKLAQEQPLINEDMIKLLSKDAGAAKNLPNKNNIERTTPISNKGNPEPTKNIPTETNEEEQAPPSTEPKIPEAQHKSYAFFGFLCSAGVSIFLPFVMYSMEFNQMNFPPIITANVLKDTCQKLTSQFFSNLFKLMAVLPIMGLIIGRMRMPRHKYNFTSDISTGAQFGGMIGLVTFVSCHILLFGINCGISRYGNLFNAQKFLTPISNYCAATMSNPVNITNQLVIPGTWFIIGTSIIGLLIGGARYKNYHMSSSKTSYYAKAEFGAMSGITVSTIGVSTIYGATYAIDKFNLMPSMQYLKPISLSYEKFVAKIIVPAAILTTAFIVIGASMTPSANIQSVNHPSDDTRFKTPM